MTVLAKIRRIRADQHRTDLDATPFGVTPDGKQIWKKTIPDVTKSPKLDEHGNEVYAKNPQSGEMLYKKYVPHVGSKEILFVEVDEGNGNVRKEPYYPPSEAEIQEAIRQGKIKTFMQRFAAAMVDKNVDPEAFFNQSALKVQSLEVKPVNGTAPMVAGTPEVSVSNLPEPKKVGKNLYQLSNGQRYKGTLEDALEAELRLQEARAVSQSLPEE